MNPALHRPAGADADSAAALWVERRRAGLSAAEERELAGWLVADQGNRDAFTRMATLAGALQRAREGNAAHEISAQLRARGVARHRRRRSLVAGASLTVLVAASALWWMRPPASSDRSATALAAAAFEPIRRLPDGSIVELNAGTEIVVRYGASSRQVDLLRGEALFRVEKDPARPFIVRAAGVDVRAVGTAFNVRFAPSGIEILVTEGKVGVADAERGKSLLPAATAGEPPVLVAGTKALILSDRVGAGLPPAEVAPVTPTQIQERLAWRGPRVEFDGAELAQAAHRLNRANRVQVIIEDDAVGKLRISGSFVVEDPQTFARLVAVTFGLETEHRSATEIVLRRK